MEAQAMAYIQKIDDLGGMLPAIERNYPQQEIAKAAYTYQKQLERKEKIMVGVNKHVSEEVLPIETLKIDAALEEAQIAKINGVKEKRNHARVQECLERLGEAASGNKNVMPLLIDAVREYATLQECCDVFRKVFGTYRDPGIF
jgi:methylmalonyl-CoA mutase N-terminal domain/subunit